jgi:hypothetical protein
VKLAEFNNRPSLEACLSSIDNLRQQISDGKIIAFMAVGIEPDDAIVGWCGSVKPVRRIRMLGAIAQGYHDWLSGTFGME